MAELDESQFVRQMLLRRGQIAWFLGAGASAGAGIPTDGHMITGVKASLFASAHGRINFHDRVPQTDVGRLFVHASLFKCRPQGWRIERCDVIPLLLVAQEGGRRRRRRRRLCADVRSGGVLLYP